MDIEHKTSDAENVGKISKAIKLPFNRGADIQDTHNEEEKEGNEVEDE